MCVGVVLWGNSDKALNGMHEMEPTRLGKQLHVGFP
jgi:hypothetical protein